MSRTRSVPCRLELLPLLHHHVGGVLGIVAGTSNLPRPLGNDSGLDEPIEIGPELLALIRRHSRAEPRSNRGLPGTIEIAHGSRRGRQPVCGSIRFGAVPQFHFHPIDDALVCSGAALRRDLRVPVHCSGPPVEHTIPAVGPGVVGPPQRSVEQFRRCAMTVVEEQPFAEANEIFALTPRLKLRCVDRLQCLARRSEMRGVVRLANVFVPVFFVAVGAAVDVRTLGSREVLLVGLALTAVAIAGKFVAGFAPFWVRANKTLIGVGMIPRGEVGLIFAQAGLTAGVLNGGDYSALMLMVLVTTFLAPPLLRALATRAGASDKDTGAVVEMTTEA